MKLGVVIVTYNPKLDIVKKNLSLLSKNNLKIIIVDNASSNINNLRQLNGVDFILEKKNVGIAKALNDGVKYLNDFDMDWILTLDQDSVLDDSYLTEFFQINLNEDISTYYPLVIDRNINNLASYEVLLNDEIRLPIQSGAFIKVKDYYLIGGMDESLFIDGVDFDFFLQLLVHKKKIQQLKFTFLYHQLGNISSRTFFGRKYYVTNHSPIRYYYNYRNMPVIIKRYRGLLATGRAGKKFKSFFNYEYKRTLKMILGEDQKIKKVKSILKGYHDRKLLSVERKRYM